MVNHYSIRQKDFSVFFLSFIFGVGLHGAFPLEQTEAWIYIALGGGVVSFLLLEIALMIFPRICDGLARAISFFAHLLGQRPRSCSKRSSEPSISQIYFFRIRDGLARAISFFADFLGQRPRSGSKKKSVQRGLFWRIAIAIFCVMIGLWRFDMTLPHFEAMPLGETVDMMGTIVEIRDYDAILRVDSIRGSSRSYSARISFSASGWKEAGDVWRVICRIEENEKTDMRYQLWDASKGIFYRCRGSVRGMHVSSPSFSLIATLDRVRSFFSERIQRIFPGDEGALLAGILYGERGLSIEAKEAFRFAGMTHLIAVSGSNIALVVSFFVPVLLWIGYRRQWAILFSGGFIFLFTVFVGAEASVIRAALMGWLAILARVFGRKAHASHLLLAVGTLMIFADPWALGFDAGFALSFLATWGLIVWSNPIATVLSWLPKALREIVSTTLAATIATTPYLLWAFEEISLAGLLTNLFAIPLTTLAMLWGFLAVIFGSFISPICYPAYGFLRLLLWIAEYSERFPFLHYSFSISLWSLLFIYAMFFIFSRRGPASSTDVLRSRLA